MYIRRTTIKSLKNGTKYFTYRLVESQRTKKGVSQRTLLNLGKEFSLSRDQWSNLSNRIEDIITGQKTLLEYSAKIENLAQRYAAQIIQSQKQSIGNDDTPDYQEVDLATIEMLRPRSVGSEHVALEAIRSLKFDTKLKELGFNKPQLAGALGSIIGRMCQPGSELSTYHWLQEVSGLGELINFDFEKINLYKMYKTSDMLLKNKKLIEEHLYTQEQRLFGFQETITLYDLTNTYFEGSSQGNSLTFNGRSKEKRSDCPLVTLALVLDSSGFPKKSEVYQGNISEPKTMAEMLKDLETESPLPLIEKEKATVVMDAGIASQDNIDWLQEHGYPYIVVSRKQHKEFDKEKAILVKKENDYAVHVQKKIDKESGETLLYCHSTKKEKKEQAIKDRFTIRFEEAMIKLSEGLHKKGCTKKYEKILIQVGRIKQKHSKAAKLYKIEVEKDIKSGAAKKITWTYQSKENTAESNPGVYCLRTNQSTWNEKTLWKTYTMLTELEAVFRSLKTDLGLRPVYHQKKDRIIGHLFLSVLAYHFAHSIRYQLKKNGINTGWGGLRKQLAGQSRTTISMQKSNGDMIHIRKSSNPEQRHLNIYKPLGLIGHPGETIKTIITGK